MNRTRLAQLLGFVAVVLFVVAGLGFRPTPGDTAPTAPSSAAGTMATTEAIAFFADRVEASPGDAVSATVLGELHNRRARETGDANEYALAIRALDVAIERLPDYPPARLALANAHFGLHDFEAATTEAERAARLDPDSGAEVVVADAAVATGDLERAEEIYMDLRERFDSPALEARIAHLSELAGDYRTAIETMAAAREAAWSGDISGEALAWFDLRLGDLAFATGDYAAAERHYRDSLSVFPRYPAAIAGLGRSLAAEGRPDEAAAAYERSIAIQPLPGTLLEAARLYESMGDEETAARHRRTIEVIGELGEGVYDRALVDHLIDVGEATRALELAETAAEGRTDAHTLDSLAWAQFHAGEIEAAILTIERALESGTSEPAILYHAGVISADSDPDRAARLISTALEASPRFDPIHSQRAAALLAELSG